MKYRVLGRTGLSVSEIGLGTEYLFKQPKDIVSSVIKEAIKNGINYFDIVFNVSQYINNISTTIKDYRDNIILTCHLGSVGKEGRPQRIRNINVCEKTFLKTLSKFGKGYIDIINIQYVKQLQLEGKVNFIGLSTHDVSIGQKAARSGHFDMIMNQINFVNHSLQGRKELLETCSKEGVGFVAIKPFAKGNLLQRNRIVNIAKYHTGGISLKRKIPQEITPIKCLSYILSQIGVSTTIPGVKNVQELNENLAYLNATDEEKDFTKILNEFKFIS